VKSDKRQSLGRFGEAIALNYLEKNGYTIQACNWRSPYGEIDIITLRDGVVVFIEVKTRASSSLGPPEISVTLRKQQHMRQAAEYYIQQHPEITADWRIDLITVQIRGGNFPPIIDQFENVVS
jgi:putative endonuclease